MDNAIRVTLLWFYISVVAMMGLGLLWIASVATFWMFPVLQDPPTVTVVFGLLLRLGVWSVVSAGWTAVGIVGWRRLVGDIERWLKRNQVDY